MIEKTKLRRYRYAMYKAANILMEMEDTDNEQDLIFVRDMEYEINNMIGSLEAYEHGIRQEA